MALALAALVFLPAAPAQATGNHGPSITVTSTGDCPDTSVKVTVSGLVSGTDYDIRIDGVKQTVVVTNGVAVFTVANKGKQITVNVNYVSNGRKICIEKCFTVKPVPCTPPTPTPPPTPDFSGSVDACQTAGGTGSATLNFSNLENGRSYWITVAGKDRFAATATNGKYTTTVDLQPGTYDVTISSDATTKSAAIPARVFSVTVKPCPDKSVSVQACQAEGGKGAATFSFTGLDDSRTYWLTVGQRDRVQVTPVDGKVTTTVELTPSDYDVTLVADVTSSQPLTTVLTTKVTVEPCPEFVVAVDACKTIGGTGTAGLTFTHLDDSRTYTVSIDGKDSQSVKSDKGSWTSSVPLAPGTHEITIESPATDSLPAIEKVTLTATISPCPQAIDIDLGAVCAPEGEDGSVSVKLSGFVTGRDYRVVFAGVASESTFSKTLTASAGDEIVDGLIPGEYTLTVEDLAAVTETNAPLSWTSAVSVVPCTTDTPTNPGGGQGVDDDSVTVGDISALPHTGLELAAPFALGAGLLGLGLGLLTLQQVRTRRRNKTA